MPEQTEVLSRPDGKNLPENPYPDADISNYGLDHYKEIDATIDKQKNRGWLRKITNIVHRTLFPPRKTQ